MYKKLCTVEDDGRKANAAGLKLVAMASAIFPTDSELFRSYGEAVIPELITLALHGRRVMEAYDILDTSLANWGFWPGSSCTPPKNVNLHDAFGHILHATTIELGWERFDGEVDVYRGRDCRFLGHVVLTSKAKSETYALGSIASSFICGVSDALSKKQRDN